MPGLHLRCDGRLAIGLQFYLLVSISSRASMVSFNGEHKADNLMNFGVAWTVQTVPTGRIVMITVVCSETVSLWW